MPTVPPRIVGQLRQAALADAGLSDGQLLDAYLARRDEAAFECLVWRHGPAILGACRRILGNKADAEDAFQATFLVLVRKAHAVRPRGAVGAWLYGVACNVARKARADATRRRARELAASQRPMAEPIDPDLRPAIDHEVNRLPAKYRAAVVLCELEGQPIADAARQLGWPQGTVASRLARGRDLLARRLARHGLSLAGVATFALSTDTVASALRATRGTSATANRLADGAVRAMSLSQWKVATAIACAAVMLMGGVAYQMGRAPGDAAQIDPPPTSPKAEPAPKTDAEPKPPAVEPRTLIGRWRVMGNRPYHVLEFREQPGEGLLIAEKANHDADWFSWKIDDRKDPKEIDISARVEGASFPNRGIYAFSGDRLIIYLGAPLVYQGDPGKHSRPATFDVEGKPGPGWLELERERVAWGAVQPNGIQYGLLAEPNGRTTVQMGEGVNLRVYAQNTTNKGVDLSVTRVSDSLPGWPVHVRDEKGNAVPVQHPPPPPGFLGGSAILKKRLLDYQVADLGAIRLTFATSEEVAREPKPIHLVPAAPGTYSIHLGSEKGTWGGAGPTGAVKLTVAEPIGWSGKVRGLQFGLALGKGQSSRIHVGERARFRVFARNSTNEAITVGTLQVLHLPMYASPKVISGEGGSLEVKQVRGPDVNPPVPNLKVGPQDIVEVPGEFTLPFLPHAIDTETHVVARPGRWRIGVPKLDTWMAGAGYATGWIDIEIVPGDVAHVDGQRIAWGPVADGLQFGLRPEKSEYAVGDTVKFTVHARNMSQQEITFRFPQLFGYWPKNGQPVIRDADGKDVKPTLAEARGPIGPQAATEHKLKPGESSELTTVLWTFVGEEDARFRAVDHAIIRPGTYTFQYPDLHATVKPAWPTGDVTLTFREPVADGVAWGPVVEGLQFGIRLDPPDKQTVRLGDSLGVTVLVRCHVAQGIVIDLPQPEYLVQVGLGPTLKDSAGRDVKVTFPERDSLPMPRYKRFNLSPGERKELLRTEWPMVRDKREGNESYFRVAPGEYSIRFNNLSDPRKEGFDAKPTGELKFTVRE